MQSHALIKFCVADPKGALTIMQPSTDHTLKSQVS